MSKPPQKTSGTGRGQDRKPSTRKPHHFPATKKAHAPLRNLASVIQMIHDHGEGQKFSRAARVAGASVTLDAKTINFLKDYLEKHPTMSKKALGKKVITAQPPCDPGYECKM